MQTGQLVSAGDRRETKIAGNLVNTVAMHAQPTVRHRSRPVNVLSPMSANLAQRSLCPSSFHLQIGRRTAKQKFQLSRAPYSSSDTRQSFPILSDSLHDDARTHKALPYAGMSSDIGPLIKTPQCSPNAWVEKLLPPCPPSLSSPPSDSPSGITKMDRPADQISFSLYDAVSCNSLLTVGILISCQPSHSLGDKLA